MITLASLVLPMAFMSLAVVLSPQSSLRAALRTPDGLVIAVLGAGGWAFSRLLDTLSKRFDAVDAALQQLLKELRAR